MRIMLIVVLIGILAVTGYGLYFIRTVTHDPDVWHVDPRSVPPADTPNTVRVAPQALTEYPVDFEAPVYDADAAQLARAFDTFVMEQPRVERIAGSLETGTSTLALYSRSRFWHSDMGVNRQRVDAWLKSIESFRSETQTLPSPTAEASE